MAMRKTPDELYWQACHRPLYALEHSDLKHGLCGLKIKRLKFSCLLFLRLSVTCDIFFSPRGKTQHN